MVKCHLIASPEGSHLQADALGSGPRPTPARAVSPCKLFRQGESLLPGPYWRKASSPILWDCLKPESTSHYFYEPILTVCIPKCNNERHSLMQELGNAASGVCTMPGQVTLDKSCNLSEYVYINSSQDTSQAGVGSRGITKICYSSLIIVSTICLSKQTVSLKAKSYVNYFFIQLTKASYGAEHLVVNQINTCGHNGKIILSYRIFVVFIQIGWDCIMYARIELPSYMHTRQL